MIRTEANTLIARPTEAVFDFVAIDFFENYRQWSPEVVSVKMTSNGPIRLGSTGQQVRVDNGFRTNCSFRVGVYEEDKRIDFVGVSAPFLSSYRFQDIAGKTRLTFIFEYKGPELLVLPFKKHIRRTVHEGAKRVVHNIKLLLETEAGYLSDRLEVDNPYLSTNLKTGSDTTR